MSRACGAVWTGARDAFDRQFRHKELPGDIPAVAFPVGAPPGGLPLMVLLRDLGLAATTSDANRLIEGGWVKLDGVVVKNQRRLMTRPAREVLIQRGLDRRPGFTKIAAQ